MKNPYKAGVKHSLTASSPQQVEAWALIELAGRLDRAAKSGDKDQLLEAMRLNWRVWTIFHGELANPEHTVPLSVRENMLSLCRYVDKRSIEIIRNPKPELVEVLITINRHIGNGLLGNPGEEDTATMNAAINEAEGSNTQSETTPAPAEQPALQQSA